MKFLASQLAYFFANRTVKRNLRALLLAEMLDGSLARRILGGETRANVIGRFWELLIAAAPVTGTLLVGKTLSRAGCAR